MPTVTPEVIAFSQNALSRPEYMGWGCPIRKDGEWEKKEQ
jgi:hypothetical protein